MCCNTSRLAGRPWGHWRDLLSAVMPALDAHGLIVTAGDVHMFGIAMGSSIDTLMQLLNPSLQEVPSYPWKIGLREGGAISPPPRAWWGYDSFKGLPEEKDGMEKVASWKQGEYAHDPRKHYTKRYGHAIEFVAGFYGDSLTRTLAVDRGMRPAMYIDIDCDLYSSTAEALAW